LIVDCLLPGQIRQLGQSVTYVTRRQAVKTSQRDCEIRGGEYVALDRSNYATALKVWLPLAEQGDPAAQTYVGEIFEKGLGVPPDYNAAMTWYRRAAEKGFSRAAINLGGLYEQGLGVPKDPKQALNWYRKAAGLGELSFAIVPENQSAVVQQLQSQVATLQKQLKDKQDELTSTQRELENLRRNLDQRRSDADGERREIARQRQELEALRKTQQNTSDEQIRELQRSIGDREARLAAKDKEVAELRTSLARAEKSSGAQQIELARLQKQSSDQPPQIQIIEPQLTATRGIAIAQVPARVDRLVLVGRVDSGAGILSLTVNGREEKLDSGNLFKTQIAVQKPNETVRIVAVDRSGKRATLDFQIPDRTEVVNLPPDTGSAAEPSKPQVGYPAPRGVSFGRYHALVIGNNDYRLLPKLETAANDAKEVARILREQYGFNVTLLVNANRYETLAALNALRERLTEDDNLLIYYAGHGELDRKNQRGNWLPIDAEQNSSANWISNITITDILNAMTVKQLLVMADSCYSGTLTRSALGHLEAGVSAQEAMKVMQLMARQRSRMVLTSGGVEPVIDSVGGANSVFARSVVELLQSNSGVLPGQELFRNLQLRVAAVAQRIDIRQVPEYAPIKFAGHESGDFFFVRTN
jgi:caspase domain-containing protein/Sel1 repeat-containing protein